MASDLQSLRLGVKRTFMRYYLALCSPEIADPSEAFAACHDYLSALCDRLGPDEFMCRLDEETVSLAGQIEQDLTRQLRDSDDPTHRVAPVGEEDVEDRLRDCFEHALKRLHLHDDSDAEEPDGED